MTAVLPPAHTACRMAKILLCKSPVFRAILVDLFALLSFFGEGSLSQSKSLKTGGLGFVVLDVHCS